jgi:hypothetical protein
MCDESLLQSLAGLLRFLFFSYLVDIPPAKGDNTGSQETHVATGVYHYPTVGTG